MSSSERHPEPICNAPFSSLHLDPRGNVRACCQNVWQRLGNVRESSLREIWDGPATAALRDRLSQGDLGLGCELCAVEFEMGNAESAFLHQFADLPVVDATALRWPRQLELALSIACNLQCIMCNGEFSSSIRVHREGRAALPSVYGDQFFEELDDFLPHLDRVTFLGGEPFLGPEPLRVMGRLAELGLTPTCHVNTNGSQWTPRVQRLVQSLPMHIAVSVDGWSARTIESVRVGIDRDSLVRNVDKIRATCAEHGNGFSLTFCLMTTNWHELPEVLEWGERLDCDVFINTVTNPPGLSLHHAIGRDIGAVLEDYRSRDARCRSVLRRNLPVWERSVDYVASLADRPGRSDDVQSVAALANARAAIARWGEHGDPVVMEVDDALLISGFSPDARDVFGVDLTALVGEPSVTFMESMAPRLGRLAHTELHLETGGVERRVFHFDSDGERTQLAATMVRRSGGETWFIALRRPVVSEPVAVTVGPTRVGRPGAGA